MASTESCIMLDWNQLISLGICLPAHIPNSRWTHQRLVTHLYEWGQRGKSLSQPAPRKLCFPFIGNGHCQRDRDDSPWWWLVHRCIWGFSCLCTLIDPIEYLRQRHFLKLAPTHFATSGHWNWDTAISHDKYLQFSWFFVGGCAYPKWDDD